MPYVIAAIIFFEQNKDKRLNDMLWNGTSKYAKGPVRIEKKMV